MNLSVRTIPAFGSSPSRGGRPMQTHNSSCLAGPNAQFRAWRQQDSSPRPEKIQALPETAPDDDLDFRADLVVRVRRQIADGTYGTEEQWDSALENLLRYLDEAG